MFMFTIIIIVLILIIIEINKVVKKNPMVINIIEEEIIKSMDLFIKIIFKNYCY